MKTFLKTILTYNQINLLIQIKKKYYDPFFRMSYFLESNMTYKEFFSHNAVKNSQYVVLRWPTHPGKGDLDLLVDNKNLERISKVLILGTRWKNKNKIRVELKPKFAISGHIPDFHEAVVNKILEKPKIGPFCAKVPRDNILLLTLIYHAVYHRGEKSGIPPKSSMNLSSKTSDHNYAEVIFYLCQNQNIDLEFNLEGMDQFLKKNKWQPPVDYRIKCAQWNEWLTQSINQELTINEINKKITVFILRKKFFSSKSIQEIRKYLNENFWEIILEKKLTKVETNRTIKQIRGSIWNLEPGLDELKPYYILICEDMNKNRVNFKSRSYHPWKDSRRTVTAKNKIREIIQLEYPNDIFSHSVHSSDSSEMAMAYARIILDEKSALFKALIRRVIS